MTYSSYLRLPDLLDIQDPQGPPPVAAELLFIVDHQAHELWFKVLLDTLEGVRDALLADRTADADWLLRRAHAVQRLLIGQVGVLETMSPEEFRGFRDSLGTASGLQSVQYHELEFLSGAKDPAYPRRANWLSDAERQRLERRLAEPTLWDAFLTLLKTRGLDLHEALRSNDPSPNDPSPNEPSHDDLRTLADDLIAYDALAHEWRFRHLQMVERQIGTAPGTGGTPGAGYLRSNLEHRYFPLLWDVRAQE